MTNMPAPTPRVAIGSIAGWPTVCGVGDSASAAVADANSEAHSNGAEVQNWVICEVTPEIVARILDGEVRCDSLGIAVRVRDGEITDAEMIAS